VCVKAASSSWWPPAKTATAVKLFYRWFAEAKIPQEVTAKIARIAQRILLPDQWEAQYWPCADQMHRNFSLEFLQSGGYPDYAHAASAGHRYGLKNGAGKDGEKADITVIPDGVSVIVENKRQ